MTRLMPSVAAFGEPGGCQHRIGDLPADDCVTTSAGTGRHGLVQVPRAATLCPEFVPTNSDLVQGRRSACTDAGGHSSNCGLAKVRVAGWSPVVRSEEPLAWARGSCFWPEVAGSGSVLLAVLSRPGHVRRSQLP